MTLARCRDASAASRHEIGSGSVDTLFVTVALGATTIVGGVAPCSYDEQFPGIRALPIGPS